MKINRYSILAVSISLCLSSTAYSGGFSVTTQSASGGGAASTNHAMAEDASAMFYNPALLSSVEGTQFNVGLSLINPDLTVTNVESRHPTPAFRTLINGSGTAEPTSLAATPSLYYKRNLSPSMAFGLGLNVPHGVSSEYEKDSFARYEATESALSVLNVNPALSWRVNQNLDLGAGLNLQYGSATLAKSVDSYLLCALISQNPSVTTANCSSLGGAGVQANDATSTVEAGGVAYGFNIGAAYHPSSNTTISLGLRSGVKHELEGDVDFDNLDTAAAALGAAAGAAATATGTAILGASGYLDRDAGADLELPATASLAFATKMNPRLTLHGDVTWTDWSSVPEIRIEFPDVTGSVDLADSVTSLNWEDTVRVGAGVTYQASGKTKLRAGVAYNPTPTPNAQYRTPRAPSSDTLWFTVGAGHQFSKKLSVDASLAYIHLEDMKIDYTSPSTADYWTRANVEADAISAALSLNYKFK